ncbi:MAG: tetratricopeptide repeat protein [Lentisphaeria bacterium]
MLVFWVQAEGYKELLEIGDKYYNQFKTEEALESYTKAYEMNKGSFESLLRMVRIHNSLGEELKLSNDKEAEVEFEKAYEYGLELVNKYPDSAKSHFELASSAGNLALYKGGSTKVELSRTIERSARESIRLEPNYSNGYVVLGIYNREVSELNWILKKIAQNILGGLPDGSMEESEKLLKKGVDLDPKAIFPRYHYGITLERNGKISEAILQYRLIQNLKYVHHLDRYHQGLAKERLEELEK